MSFTKFVRSSGAQLDLHIDNAWNHNHITWCKGKPFAQNIWYKIKLHPIWGETIKYLSSTTPQYELNARRIWRAFWKHIFNFIFACHCLITCSLLQQSWHQRILCRLFSVLKKANKQNGFSILNMQFTLRRLFRCLHLVRLCIDSLLLSCCRYTQFDSYVCRLIFVCYGRFVSKPKQLRSGARSSHLLRVYSHIIRCQWMKSANQ